MTLPLRHLRKSLAFRFLAVSVLAVLAIVPVRLMELRDVRQKAEETGKATVSRIATDGVGRLTAIIDEARTILTITALLPTFASPGAPDCHLILTRVVSEIGWMNSFSAVAKDGTVLCSSSSTAEGLNVANRPHFQDTTRLRSFQMSGIVVSRVTKAPAIFATIPVTAPGSGTAALMLAINASWFTDMAEEVAHSAPGGLVAIIDTEGKVIGQSNEASAPGGAQSLPQIDLTRFDRDDSSPLEMPDGRRLVVAVRDIPNTKSRLVVGVPQAELDRQALMVETSLITDLLIAIAVILIVFWLAHYSVLRPILTLAAAAHRLGRGRFDVSIDSRHWAREFQSLARALTSASTNLANRALADAAVKASLRAETREDPLTQIRNRRGLDEYVELEWRMCRRKKMSFAAIAFDIDFFKLFNDRYGHDAGDQALCAVARIMRDQAEQARGLAARTGGEEFTIIIPDTTASQAKTIADAVSLRVTALRIPHSGSPLGTLTISAGVAATLPGDGITAADVFRTADCALYGAKEAGRNTITVGDLVVASHPAQAVADDDGTRQEPSRDRESRRLPAFPSARSL